MVGLAVNEPVVHTTGVNWDSLIPILCTIITSTIALAVFLNNRSENRDNNTKVEIKEAVDHLSEVLIERLETKENVAALRERIARLERDGSPRRT